jgi:hypothetical protein
MEKKISPSTSPKSRAAYRRRPDVKARAAERARQRRKDPEFRAKEARNQKTYAKRHPEKIKSQIAARADGRPKMYFIQTASGPIKIGWTKSKKANIRMQELQVGNHELLVLLAAVPATEADEAAIHERFAHARIRGEWFHPVPELLQFILTASAITPSSVQI